MGSLLVTVDALRADHLGQYGYERDTMPVLDELAEEGTRFANAFANAPYTRISVPAIQASRHLAYTDVERTPTLAEALTDAGVTTAVIGTQVGMNLVEGDFGYVENYDLGRDEYHEQSNERRPLAEQVRSRLDQVASSVGNMLERSEPAYRLARGAYDAVAPDPGFRYLGYTSAERVTDRAIEWLDAHRGDEWFLWIHYMEGHRPYGVHDDEPAYLDTPVGEETIRELMRTAGTEPDAVTEGQRELIVDLYDSDLRYCSRHLRRLFDWLRHSGLWGDTDIVFSSDHGEEFGEHGRFFHRNFPYDELIHVPLVVKSDRGSGKVVDDQRELLDLAPTLCSFHDVPPEDTEFTGRALFEGDGRRVVVLGAGTADEGEGAVAGRWNGWKFMSGPGTERLYHLAKDPAETNDVAPSNPDVVRRFRRQIPDALFDRNPESLTVPDRDDQRRRLESLGYLE